MPYKNSRRRRKNSRYNTYSRAASQLAKDIAIIGSLVNSELHYHLSSEAVNDITFAGEVHSLSDIPQGDSVTTRAGNSVLPRYFNMNININKDITGPVHETIRLILFRYWGQSTSGTPSVPTVLDILTTKNPLSFLNPDNTGGVGRRSRRIEIKRTKLFTINNLSNTSRTFKFNINTNGPKTPLAKKSHIKFASSSTNPPISGGYYFLIISDNTDTTKESSFSYKAALNYYDN